MNEKLKSLGINVLMIAIFLALGPGLLYYGVSTLVSGPSSEVRCGDKVMHDGNVCRQTRNGSSVATRGYASQRAEQNSFMNRVGWPVFALVVSGFTLFVGAYVLRATIKRRRQGPSEPAGP